MKILARYSHLAWRLLLPMRSVKQCRAYAEHILPRLQNLLLPPSTTFEGDIVKNRNCSVSTRLPSLRFSSFKISVAVSPAGSLKLRGKSATLVSKKQGELLQAALVRAGVGNCISELAITLVNGIAASTACVPMMASRYRAACIYRFQGRIRCSMERPHEFGNYPLYVGCFWLHPHCLL